MRIGLVDVDGHNYPNLALMKISAWHKAQGDEVMFADLFHSYDIVYKSKVFTWTEDDQFSYDTKAMQFGGTGYGDYSKVLPNEVEHILPDYGLYGIDYALGFTTRGCIRHCPFCIVHDKEGMLHDHADVREFLGEQRKVVLLDNNIIASRHGISQLEWLRDNGIPTDCNQGLDARILCKSEHLCNLIADIPPFGTRGIRIACDQENEIEPCHKTIRMLMERNPKVRVLVYCILTDDYEDSLRRVLEWRRYGHAVAVYAPPTEILQNKNRQSPVGREGCRDGHRATSSTSPATGRTTLGIRNHKGRRQSKTIRPSIQGICSHRR